MRFGINTLDDFDLSGKTILVRVDMNQPVDRERDCLKDTTRIKACVKTIGEIADAGAKTVLLAHQGADIEYQNFYTTRPHGKVLSGFLGREVQFIDDVCGPAARDQIGKLQEGDILLLDNVRFMAEEQTLFELKLALTHEQQAQTQVVQKLAPLADLYVCDAFAAAHRDQPSLCGFEQLLPSAMGRLFEEEYCVISQLMEHPKRPCVFVLGGAKIADAFLMMSTVLDKAVADVILTGGLVGQICTLASGKALGKPTEDFITKKGFGKYVQEAESILQRHPGKVALPLDFAWNADGARREIDAGALPSDQPLADIGAKTIAAYAERIMEAQTVFVNGPMGVFEDTPTQDGTKALWEALGRTPAYTVIGGGDSVAAANLYRQAEKISYICTGGGALIRFLSGDELPVVRALRESAQKFNLRRCL